MPEERASPMSLPEEIRDKKILLIDDDESIRDSLQMFFLAEGLRIDAVETAEEGLDALSRRHYDVIITDYNLPGMDGPSFFKRVHQLCPASFKILMTAYAKEPPVAAADLGVDECIQKPFSTKIIMDSLSRSTGKDGSRARAQG